jgi:predicted N-formylglutamate amidohydrolase
MKPIKIIVSCEHANNHVPQEYFTLFSKEPDILHTHFAYDAGAFPIAKQLSTFFQCPLFEGKVSRLIIDLNRSLTHSACFSKYSKGLNKSDKQEIINQFYLPYRAAVEKTIVDYIDSGHQVLHLSIHSFTPVMNNITRNAGIAFLYDPKHHAETEFVRLWTSILTLHTPHYKVRKNYPYRGDTDGFTKYLRKKHPESCYLGIEVESNQALLDNPENIEKMASLIQESLSELIEMV